MTTMNKPEQIMKFQPLMELFESLIQTHDITIHRGSEGSTNVTTVQPDIKDNKLILSDKVEGRKLSPSAVIIPAPSFIITDIEMPHMDGLEFLDILRKKNENVPAIITSAYSNKEYLLQSIKLQLSDYLMKPIDYNDLMLALERVAISLKKNSLQSVVEIYDGVFYRPIKKIVSVDGINNKLTAIESELLEFLILNKGVEVL